ncbi:MAG: transcriptional regulator, Crp/Fnr family [Reyranella sp.]|nr:transcriptional regulator, Crp/Fnr family [Reyranella sp.]
MLALGTMRRWTRHEILFRAGDPMSSFFKIRDGVVAVSRTLDDGRRQIVAVRSAGECVGYLDSAGRYAFEGQALTDVEACSFDRRGFDALVATNPALAGALAEALSQALTQSAEAMLVVGKLRSTERVAHFLAEMVLVHRRSSTAGGPLRLHMNRTEIADYLGLTVETVSRSIGKLKKRSVISLLESDEVIVLNDALLGEIGKSAADEWQSAIG